MSVNRFDMHGSSHINGEYVSYSDCAKLESQLAALKEENERLTKVKKNYLETILAIRTMDDIDQARQWCNDTLSGCEPLEATLFNLQNERDVLKARVAELEKILEFYDIRLPDYD